MKGLEHLTNFVTTLQYPVERLFVERLTGARQTFDRTRKPVRQQRRQYHPDEYQQRRRDHQETQRVLQVALQRGAVDTERDEAGGDILVLAEINYLGETELQYYGQYSTLYSANLKVRNILLSERRTLGPGWTRKVDFTTLNAAEKAKEAVDPILPEVTAILSQFK